MVWSRVDDLQNIHYMKAVALLLVVASAASTAAATLGSADITFEAYLTRHGKVYSDPAESNLRHSLFRRTRLSVIRQNAAYVRRVAFVRVPCCVCVCVGVLACWCM